jgi:hypothetical protein
MVQFIKGDFPLGGDRFDPMATTENAVRRSVSYTPHFA